MLKYDLKREKCSQLCVKSWNRIKVDLKGQKKKVYYSTVLARMAETVRKKTHHLEIMWQQLLCEHLAELSK